MSNYRVFRHTEKYAGYVSYIAMSNSVPTQLTQIGLKQKVKLF